MATASTARGRAIANESRQIEQSQQRAIAARQAENDRPRTALEKLAMRCEVSAGELQDTLRATVFSGCQNYEQFLALIIVSNTYGLNPLLKEIYAFPAKGGGIVPMVSIDGWIRLMNEHPEFDGIEFDYHVEDDGTIKAIESVIHRKDRTHPIKVIEYLDECERPTEPWKKSPKRMLRHRALIQGVRVAFGFSGIVADGDENVIEAEYTQSPAAILPSRQTLAEELGDKIPNFDRQTGEVEPTRDRRGFTQVDEDTARALDAGNNPDGADDDVVDVEADHIGAKPGNAKHGESWYEPDSGKLRYAHDKGQHGIKWYLQPPAEEANDGTLAEDNPTAAEGPADEQRGEPEPRADDAPVWKQAADTMFDRLKNAKTVKAVNEAETDWVNTIRNGIPDDAAVDWIEKAIVQRKRDLAPKKEG